MIKRQMALLSAAACLCLLLGIGIGLNGCGQKGDLSEKEENSVESQMGEVQQGVEQNTEMQNSFMEIRATLKRENGHAHRNRCTHQIRIYKTEDRAEMDSCKRLNGSVHRHGLEAGAWQNPGV